MESANTEVLVSSFFHALHLKSLAISGKLFSLFSSLDIEKCTHILWKMHTHRMQAVERYRRVFGPLEHNVTIGGVEFVFVDAQALDGKDPLLCLKPSF